MDNLKKSSNAVDAKMHEFKSLLDGVGGPVANLLAREYNQLTELMSKFQELATNQSSIGQYYRVEEEIGDGSCGIVYKVRHVKTRKLYAMKAIALPHSVLEEDVVREVSILYDINHENIIKLDKAYVDWTSVYLMMEYAPKDLDAVLNSGVEISLETMKVWLKQILSAVAYLHRKNIVHRDLKPANILVDDNNDLKLADFGSSKVIFADAQWTPEVTALQYRAPELLLGYESLDQSSRDTWTIGCIFAEIVIGERLFEADSTFDLIDEIFSKLGTPDEGSLLTTLPRFPTDVTPHAKATVITRILDEDGNNLLLQLLCLDPSQRISAEDALNHPYLEGA